MLKEPSTANLSWVRMHEVQTTSTMDLARAFANQLKPNEVRIYTADHQTQARGTHARKWLYPGGINICPTYSFLIEEALFNQLHFLPLITGYAVSLMLNDYRLEATIKWPNDVLVHAKKISGILCESFPLTHHRMVNIGIGMNVNMDQSLCEVIDQPATSMQIESGLSLGLEEVLARLTQHLLNILQLFLTEGFQVFHHNISARLEKFSGKDIIFDTQVNGLFKGKVLGVNNQGHLMLEGSYAENFSTEVERLSFLSGRILERG